MSISQSDRLRAIAAVLDEHPDLPAPYVTSGGSWADATWQLMIAAGNEVEQKALARRIVKTIGGKWDKQDLGDTMLYQQSREGFSLRISADRSAVCERVVTGIETVTIPAIEAQPERVEIREVVEWRCEPLLAEVVAR